MKITDHATEYGECVTLVQYLDVLKRTGKIKMYSHIPMETYTKFRSQKLKNMALGVTSGFPDYVVVTNKEALYIEMKRPKGGHVSDNQKIWIDALNSVGVKAVVCYGYNEAEKFLKANI